MRSAKDRTIEKKRRQKTTKVQKTEASRRKRLANKHKREAIHAINPDLKITIVDGVTHTDDGINGKVAVEVINGKIRAITPADFDSAIEEYKAETDGGRAINDQIEKERIGMFDRLSDRFRKKKINL